MLEKVNIILKREYNTPFLLFLYSGMVYLIKKFIKINDNKESLTLIMERDLFEKFKYVAEHNGNSFDEEKIKNSEENIVKY